MSYRHGAQNSERYSVAMVLELAILNVIPTREADFERSFAEARAIIASMPGFVSLELHRCLEQFVKVDLGLPLNGKT